MDLIMKLIIKNNFNFSSELYDFKIDASVWVI